MTRLQMDTLAKLVDKGFNLREMIDGAPYLNAFDILEGIAIDPKKYGHFYQLLKEDVDNITAY